MIVSRDIPQRKHCNQRILIPYNLKNYLIQHLLYNCQNKIKELITLVDPVKEPGRLTWVKLTHSSTKNVQTIKYMAGKYYEF